MHCTGNPHLLVLSVLSVSGVRTLNFLIQVLESARSCSSMAWASGESASYFGQKPRASGRCLLTGDSWYGRLATGEREIPDRFQIVYSR